MGPLIFFFFIGFLSLKSEAQILVRASGASPQLYQEYLQAHPQQKSYAQHLLTQHMNSTYGERDLFQISEQQNLSMNELKERVLELRSRGPLSKLAWSFLADYLSAHKPLLESQNKRSFTDLFCEARFYSEQDGEASCQWMSLSLEDLRRQWPEAHLVVIETKVVELQGQLLLPRSEKLHWLLISDTRKEIHFWGSFEELKRQHLHSDYLVEGSCGQFSTSTDSISLLSSGFVFFSADCVAKFSPETQERKPWLERNKSWVLPLSIIAVGAAAASQLQGKKLVFKDSVF
ncbi:hypothetical protein D3C87_176340 [compost metagenome]